jgi:hypothetical protein
VQPRPYIPAFRAYLFAPETQEWLDTMVWSSAQPHSVTDMVDKVFGDAKSELVAVWDRESLGLSKVDYCEYFINDRIAIFFFIPTHLRWSVLDRRS